MEFSPPDADVRAQLGAVKVIPVSARTSRDVDDPVKGAGRGALVGAGKGAAGGFAAGASLCQTGDPLFCGVGLVLGAALAVPGAVVGSGVGASLAHPAEEVEAATENLIIALADARPHEEVAWRISMVQLPNRLQVGEAEDSEWADYRDLADEGWDTVLEVEVVWFELFVQGDINPKISPKLILQGRLIRTRDNTELYRRKWLLWGEERNYFEAAADNARLFRQDLQQAYGALADRIVDDLFQSSLIEQDRPSREGEIVTLESAPPLAVSAKNRAQPSGAEATTESSSETAQ